MAYAIWDSPCTIIILYDFTDMLEKCIFYGQIFNKFNWFYSKEICSIPTTQKERKKNNTIIIRDDY